MPNCLLVVTGAPLALRCVDIAAALTQAGWSVQVVTTPAATAWVDDATISTVSGRPALSEHRDPSEAKLSEAPDAVVVAPATFNTIAKTALGIADTYAHSQLCEVIGAGLPIVMVPMLNNKLWPSRAGRPPADPDRRWRQLRRPTDRRRFACAGHLGNRRPSCPRLRAELGRRQARAAQPLAVAPRPPALLCG